MPSIPILLGMAPEGGCCTCARQIDACHCETQGCALTCRSKSGTAGLCGFSEFTDVSNPPRKYRRKEIAGRIEQAYWNVAGCPNTAILTDGTCGWGATQSGWTYTVGVTFVAVRTNATTCVITVQTASGVRTRPAGDQVIIEQVPVWFAVDGVTGLLGPGQSWATIWPSAPTAKPIFMKLLSDMPFQGFAVTPDHPPVWGGTRHFTYGGDTANSTVTDEWSRVDQYSSGACAFSQTDTSKRFTKAFGRFPDTSVVGSAISAPALDYNPAVISETTTRTTRTFEPEGECMVVSPGLWASASGAGVVESLSQEDTEDDAVARAVAPVAWSDEAVCTSPLAAFRTQRGASDVTFGFRETQVKATLGTIAHPLIIDHQYVCTIGYYRRALGSGGVWLWYADQEISVTADTTVEITDWFDVPNEEGFETIPLTCDVVDVTF